MVALTQIVDVRCRIISVLFCSSEPAKATSENGECVLATASSDTQDIKIKVWTQVKVTNC